MGRALIKTVAAMLVGVAVTIGSLGFRFLELTGGLFSDTQTNTRDVTDWLACSAIATGILGLATLMWFVADMTHHRPPYAGGPG